jgi:TRAP-type C4-dicarboxylate transport system permease small subunit
MHGSHMSKWYTICDVIERYLLSSLLFLVCLLLLIQLATRMLGTSALGWTEEAARYFFIWLVFLGSGFAVRQNSHIMADILRPNSIGPLAIAWLIFVECILFAVSLILLWSGAELVLVSSNTSMVSLDLSMAYRSAAVPAGAAFMVIFSLSTMARLLRQLGDSRDGPEQV